jgi:cellulose synthase/poly-beta-1,6-N-acetylglucosamine synthase-like glycosyltransferase
MQAILSSEAHSLYKSSPRPASQRYGSSGIRPRQIATRSRGGLEAGGCGIGARDTEMSHEGRDLTQLSVVIPCYIEHAVIQELHRRLTRACHSQVGDRYELVLVNDGSSDKTWAILQELAHNDDRIVAVDLSLWPPIGAVGRAIARASRAYSRDRCRSAGPAVRGEDVRV